MNKQGKETSLVFFSEHFCLDSEQESLDFVDIPVSTDIPLFIDPYAFKIGSDSWSIECNNLIVDFFESLVIGIQNSDDERVRFLLGNLHEPNMTHLGHSNGRPKGRGIGREQSVDLNERIKESNAAKTGLLKEISDCELMIPGIGHDKISDICINIIRRRLVEFTQIQCEIHSIPTRRVQAGPYWSHEDAGWRNDYGNLPIYEGYPIILVPKLSVRYRPASDHQNYYRNFVLEYLIQENIRSNTSLVQVLKNGKRKVTKKSLAELYPCDKEVLFRFSRDHPEVLSQYKESLSTSCRPLTEKELQHLMSDRLGRAPGPLTINQIQIHNQVRVYMENKVVQGDNICGVVGTGFVNARDITIYRNHIDGNQSLDNEMKRVLMEARASLEEVELPVEDKNDAADNLGKLTSELEKPEKNEGRIKRYWRNIKEIAPTIASVLNSIKMIRDMIQ